MKDLTKFIYDNIFETSQGSPIDDQWINDNKPVRTADGRQVIIMTVDMKQVPNIIKGKVKMKNELFDYEWQDDGICVKAIDQYGNPKKADYSDKLVKDM